MWGKRGRIIVCRFVCIYIFFFTGAGRRAQTRGPPPGFATPVCVRGCVYVLTKMCLYNDNYIYIYIIQMRTSDYKPTWNCRSCVTAKCQPSGEKHTDPTHTHTHTYIHTYIFT